ncbi:hypothetical protein QE152_g15704 [Popillia japonica]|uniref:Uncharacterized protein n=1 Tax=Popillia japonica TaxID=7064 RepID=A0AAW1L7F9_POPJA
MSTRQKYAINVFTGKSINSQTATKSRRYECTTDKADDALLTENQSEAEVLKRKNDYIQKWLNTGEVSWEKQTVFDQQESKKDTKKINILSNILISPKEPHCSENFPQIKQEPFLSEPPVCGTNSTISRNSSRFYRIFHKLNRNHFYLNLLYVVLTALLVEIQVYRIHYNHRSLLILLAYMISVKHTKTCPENKEILNRRQTALSDGQTTLLMGNLMKYDKLLTKELFPRMRADKINLIAKKDMLICQYGYSYMKGRKSKGNLDFVRQNIRRLAKLLMFCRQEKPELKDLINFLKPTYFSLLLKGVSHIAGYNPETDVYESPLAETDVYESPTLAMNFGTLLKKCCDLAYIHEFWHFIKKML